MNNTVQYIIMGICFIVFKQYPFVMLALFVVFIVMVIIQYRNHILATGKVALKRGKECCENSSLINKIQKEVTGFTEEVSAEIKKQAPKSVIPSFNSINASEIILAFGAGTHHFKDDFSGTYEKLIEVFYKNKKDQHILDLIYFELIAARLMLFSLPCLELRYRPINDSSVKFGRAFTELTKSFFSELQRDYKENLQDLFRYRVISYSKAYENADDDNKYLAVSIVFYEYLSNSLKNRPLLYEVPNPDRPWLTGITSMDDIHDNSQEGIKYCLILATHIIDYSKYFFSAATCNIID